MLFFTSDLHLGHNLLVDERGFTDGDQMDEAILSSINNHVRENDELYNLGDLSFRSLEYTDEWLSRIHCKNHVLIKGNHDDRKRIQKLSHRFKDILDYKEISFRIDGEVHKKKICMLHYPMLTWNCAHRGSWSLHGHSHGSLKGFDGSTRMDVGWDVYRRPVSFEDIQRFMSTKRFIPYDHHIEGGN